MGAPALQQQQRAFKMAADEAKSKKRSGEEETEDVDSKRQKAAAAEGEDVAEDDEPEAPKESKAKNEAIAYLASFGFDGWKFKKVRQTWLLQHIYDGAKLEDRHFPQLLLYLAGLKVPCSALHRHNVWCCRASVGLRHWKRHKQL